MTCELELTADEVLVASASPRRSNHIYHSGICQAVERVGRERMAVWSRDHLTDHWRECRYCAGEHDPSDCGPDKPSCPICGEAVVKPAQHIRAEHGTGGESDG